MSMKAKSYLVTGGTGFIGAALVRRLIEAGHRVRVLDNQSRGSTERLAGLEGSFELVEADIRDPESVEKATRGVDSVCHLAFVNGTEFFYNKPDVVLDVGVKGMVNVLDACLKHDVRELVLASSSEVYQSPPVIPTDETAPLSIPDPLNPRYSYAGGKIISEIMAVNYGRKYFDRVLIFRPHNVYGPDMGWEHVIPQFALRMRKLCRETQGTIQFPIQGSGEETRSFCYIDDFTDGLLLMMEKGEHLNIYHIGTMEEQTIAKVARLVAEHFGREIEIVPGAPAAGATTRRCPDTGKLESLGYRPKFSLETGLRKTCRWYDENADRQPSRDIVHSGR